jgi:hypothetical protein
MPIRKTHLSAAESRETLACLNQLRCEGLDLGEDSGIFASWKENSPLVITPGRDFGVICDYPVRNTVYAIPLHVVARERTIIEHCWVESGWDDQTIAFPFLIESGGRYQLGSLSYRTCDVLNDHFDQPFTMSRGDFLEGIILAYGCEAIPEKVRGANALVQVTLADTLGREARSQLSLAVECSPNMEQTGLPPRRKEFQRRSLFILEPAGARSRV